MIYTFWDLTYGLLLMFSISPKLLKIFIKTFVKYSVAKRKFDFLSAILYYLIKINYSSTFIWHVQNNQTITKRKNPNNRFSNLTQTFSSSIYQLHVLCWRNKAQNIRDIRKR